jgi:chromosome segregation and condensation protein ScpB
VRGSSSDSAIGTLLQRQLIALGEHRLFTTTPAFLKYLGLRDLADLPPLPGLESDAGGPSRAPAFQSEHPRTTSWTG